ncbi:MAG: PCMD domain-containing protein [Alistipes sp.]|nr:PCMD domain-containing protein [Alistipes sp.]
MKTMIHNIRRVAVVVMLAVAAIACIKNDVPLPVIKLDILSLTAEGTVGEAKIDATAHTVDIVLEETTDIRNVKITEVTVTEGAEMDVLFPGTFDLRHPLYVMLTMYQDYEWTIAAEQTIERYFRVEGQIGESVIDPVNHVATAYVPMDADLNAVTITDIKLGPKDISTYFPDPATLTSFDGTVRHVTVTYHGDVEEMWTLCVVPTDVEVAFSSVDAWAKRIWLYADGRSDTDLGFKYRKAGDEEWITVNDVTVNGGSFSACVEGLETMTSYEVVAFSNDNLTEVVTVTTEDAYTLPNGGFEEWSTNEGIVCPYLTGAPFWGSGNDGAAMASTTLTEPTSDVRPGSAGTKAASLQSKKAAVMGIGKFAAGNIFLGEFGGLVGLDGLVNFGRPSTARPVALHGWVKYNCGTIDELGRVPSTRPDLKKGDSDEGQILIAVGNWTAEEYGGSADCPVVVNTKDESTYFDKNGKNVIGVGEMILAESTNGWLEFTLPLDYRSTSEIPTHMIIICSGSRYGDYFTGSTHSLMLVDDLELIY